MHETNHRKSEVVGLVDGLSVHILFIVIFFNFSKYSKYYAENSPVNEELCNCTHMTKPHN